MTDNVITLPVEAPEWEFSFTLKKREGVYFITPIDGLEDQCPLSFGAILDIGELDEALVVGDRLNKDNSDE